MNWVDLIIVIILLVFIWEGWKKPFVLEVLDLLSFALAFLLSLKYYSLAAQLLEPVFSVPHSFANVLGFILIWYVFEILFFILLRPLLFKHQWGLKSSTLSIIPAFLKGLIFISIILVLVSTFPVAPKIKKDVKSSGLGQAILLKTYQLEAPLKGVFGELAHDTLTFLTIQPQSNERKNLGFQTAELQFSEKLENEMISLINKERAKAGLPLLNFEENLRDVGRLHSSDMFERGYFSHYSPEGKNVADRAKIGQVSFLVIGENLAFAPNLDLAHQGLMKSPGHRANILSEDFKRVGIGIADGDEYGLMITQIFAN